MTRDYRDTVADILKAIKDIEDIVKDVDYQAFIKDKQRSYAAVYCIQVIGEAVKKMPDEIKDEYRQIPWHKISRMRDRLIHGYFSIDFERIWETVTRDLPPLKETIAKILENSQT